MCDGISFGQMSGFLGKLLFIKGEIVNPVTLGSLKLWGYVPFLILGFGITTPIGVTLRKKVTDIQKKGNMAVRVISDVAMILVLVFSMLFLVGGTYNPFIYFRF